MGWSDLSDEQKTGYGGSILLTIGNFLPIFCILGFCISYIDGDGIFIFFLGLISLYLVYSERFRGLIATGGVSLVILINGPLSLGFSFLGYGIYVLLAGVGLVFYTAWKTW
tara:strand:+ start:450 stop:782 length:333 start_codon:yes stop_codon:yes gene_type:complete